jgi:hypothetical protein
MWGIHDFIRFQEEAGNRFPGAGLGQTTLSPPIPTVLELLTMLPLAQQKGLTF